MASVSPTGPAPASNTLVSSRLFIVEPRPRGLCEAHLPLDIAHCLPRNGCQAEQPASAVVRAPRSIRSARRGDRHAARAAALDGFLDQAGSLGLFDELVDIIEPPRLAFRNDHPVQVRTVTVLEHARARQLLGKWQE